MIKTRRPWGSVKDIVLKLNDAGMSMPEMASTTGIPYDNIRRTCTRLKIRPRFAYLPPYQNYDKIKQQQQV